MFKPKFTITNKINNALLEIERARGFLEAAELKEEWIKEMQSRALILESHHSTHIEGTQLTLEQSERILTGKPAGEVRPDDRQELLNYREAMDFVSKYLNEKSEISWAGDLRSAKRRGESMYLNNGHLSDMFRTFIGLMEEENKFYPSAQSVMRKKWQKYEDKSRGRDCWIYLLF